MSEHVSGYERTFDVGVLYTDCLQLLSIDSTETLISFISLGKTNSHGLNILVIFANLNKNVN